MLDKGDKTAPERTDSSVSDAETIRGLSAQLLLARAQVHSLRTSKTARRLQTLRRIGYRPWHDALVTPNELDESSDTYDDERPRITVLGTVALLADSSFIEIDLAATARRDTWLQIAVDFGHGPDPRYCEDWYIEQGTHRRRLTLRLPAAPVAVVITSTKPDDTELTSLRARTMGRAGYFARALIQKSAEHRSPRAFAAGARKALGIVRTEGLSGLIAAIGADMGHAERYRAWLTHNEPSEADLAAFTKDAESWDSPPLLSVITPVYNTPKDTLVEMLESVRTQAYPYWEHCLVDDCSTDEGVRTILDEYAAKDDRFRVVHRAENGHISKASNDGLAMARGEFVCLLDHDDILRPHAIYRVAQAVRTNPDLDWIYSDEDKILLSGERGDPFFKPDWSPHYFRSCMYTCHLSAFRRALVDKVGGFRVGYEGAQDYDLALRIAGATEPGKVHHIPDVLYSWRIIPESTAGGPDAKPYAHIAAQKAIAADIERRSLTGEVDESVSPGFHRVRYTVAGTPRVSLVIPTRPGRGMFDDGEDYFVRRCIRSVRALSTHDDIEIVLVTDGDPPADLLDDIERAHAKVVVFTDEFNFSEKINAGVKASTGEYAVLLNDDVEVITPDWIERMLEFAQLDDVGAVGARLLFPSGNLQHAGVQVLGGNPTHAYYNISADHPGYFNSNRVVREYLAVTAACLMVKRTDFDAVGGLDPKYPLNFNDVDFCLRLRERGLASVMIPDAELVHHESVTKSGVHADEIARFREQWAERYPDDPHYNPNLVENGMFDVAPRPGPFRRARR